MIEVINLTVSYAPVSSIKSLCLTILFQSAERLLIFILEISCTLQNTILPYPKERFYLSLPHIYLEWFKIKCLKNPFASINSIELCMQAIKSIQGEKQMESFGTTDLDAS